MTAPDTRALLAANHQPITPDTKTAPEGSVTFTEQQAAEAFAAWETAFRDKPTGFMTQEEIARMSVTDYGTASAIYFMALLRKGGAT